MIRLPNWTLVALALVVLLGLTAPVLAEQAKGNIKSVTADKNEFIITDTANKEWTFSLNTDGKVFLNDKEVKLSELQSGDQVTITYEKKEDKLTASEVRGKRA